MFFFCRSGLRRTSCFRAFVYYIYKDGSVFPRPGLAGVPHTIFRVLDFSENLDRVRLLLVNIRYIT